MMDAQFNFESQFRAIRRTPRKTSLAFIVEALILLFFLVASLAIITQLFSLSANKANRSKHLEQGVIAAANVAERFSANPTGIEETTTEGDLAISCTVDEEKYANGTRYDATISVFDEDGEVYRLQTSRYTPTAYEKMTSYLAENPQASSIGATDTTTPSNTTTSKSATVPSSADTPTDAGAKIEVIE